jgi:uncharacterized cupin superfamily protein
VGITHFDEAPSRRLTVGHLDATWTALGEAAGSVGVGVRRIVVEPGAWATPVHEHGSEEELFYVLAGRGISYHGERAYEIAGGDCILYAPRRGAHSVHAVDEPLAVLAFGPRHYTDSPRFPRLGAVLVGGRLLDGAGPATPPLPVQFEHESKLGPPDVPEPSERPQWIANVADVDAERVERPRVARVRRNLGRAVGSVTTGLQHVVVDAGKYATRQHCHSAEEEIFVVLDGDGVLVLGDEETPVRPGHVVARPAGTGVAHVFRAGDGGLTFLAYGTRDPNDICFYPRSNNISFRGVGVVARLERLDYWDGED